MSLRSLFPIEALIFRRCLVIVTPWTENMWFGTTHHCLSGAAGLPLLNLYFSYLESHSMRQLAYSSGCQESEPTQWHGHNNKGQF